MLWVVGHRRTTDSLCYLGFINPSALSCLFCVWSGMSYFCSFEMNKQGARRLQTEREVQLKTSRYRGEEDKALIKGLWKVECTFGTAQPFQPRDCQDKFRNMNFCLFLAFPRVLENLPSVPRKLWERLSRQHVISWEQTQSLPLSFQPCSPWTEHLF